MLKGLGAGHRPKKFLLNHRFIYNKRRKNFLGSPK